MENQPTSDKTFEKFKWTINNFSKLNADQRLCSETFIINGHPWVIVIIPEGKGKNNAAYLSIYLVAGDLSNHPQDSSRFEHFKLALINQVNGENTITEEYIQKYTASKPYWGSERFITLSQLRDTPGFILNDTCIFEAEIAVRNPIEHVSQAYQVVSKPAVSVEPVENVANPLPKDFSVASCGELVDFKSFGNIEEAFVPLLEEVCSWHPSLVQCQKRRSRTNRFSEWAFTALGRVLHFLKTKKVKDMNEDACSHLKILWEELETCGFDLTWLEPHFQSALGMKSHNERAVQVKKLKMNAYNVEEDLKIATEELDMLRKKVDSLETDLKIATRQLVKAKEGFKETDLDAELGYGGP